MTDDIKRFAEMVRSVENPPPGDVMALGHMMRDWLEGVVADSGTKVDGGGGFNAYDLWVQMGGKTVFITLREMDPTNGA